MGGHHAVGRRQSLQEDLGVEADGEADGRHEQPDEGERKRQPRGEEQRAEAMLGDRRPKDDRQDRQGAGVEDREDPGEGCGNYEPILLTL